MKKIFIYLSLGVVFILASCSTDVEPKGQLSGPTFWSNKQDIDRALNGCYTYTGMSSFDAYEDGYTDIVYCQYPWESRATVISAGNIDDGINVGYNFEAVRRFNYFLDNVDKVPVDKAIIDKAKAEVRVLRALYYFNMANKFGAVPLFTKSISSREESIKEPTPEKDVITFVLKEIEESIPNLPDTPEVKSRFGKAAAYAIKARVHIFYEQWQQAAESSKRVMDMGRYELFKVTELTDDDRKDDYSQLMTFANDAEEEKFLKGLRSYEQLFWEKNKENSEVIFNKEYIEGTYNWIGQRFMSANLYGGWSSVTPTSNLIEKYWSKDGSVFSSPTKEEREARFKKGDTKNNPDWSDYLKEFKDRDTRLYASILFPQAPWYALMKDAKFVWEDRGKAKNTSKVGYNFRKMVDPTDELYVRRGIQDYPCIRYAEVLLTYAEAENEANGPSVSVYDALDKLRDRVGMPSIDRAMYNTKDKLRELIRTERCIELAGEGFRWNDIRRWGISSEVMKDIYAIDGGLAQERRWEDRFIRLPYPREAIDRNPKLEKAQKAKGY